MDDDLLRDWIVALHLVDICGWIYPVGLESVGG